MPFYLCDLVGTGSDGDPCVPAIAQYVSDWAGFDCRVDGGRPAGTMIVEASPDEAEALAIAGDARIVEVSAEAASALIAAVRAARA